MEYSGIKTEALLKSIIDTAIDGIVIIDEKGIVITLNPAAATMFDYEVDEVVGNNVSMLMGSPHRELHDNYIQRYLDTGEARIIGIGREIEAQKKDGTMFPMRLAVSEVRFDGESVFAGFIHDLTEVKDAEEKILRLNAELEQKVVERTEELQLAVNKLLLINKKLEHEIAERQAAEEALKVSQEELRESLQKEKELSELKSRFVSMASHEFRTPLSTILSSTALIGRYTQSDQQKRRDKHLGRIKSAVQTLNNILNDFLSISKIEEGRIDVATEACNVPELSAEVIEEMEGLLKKEQKVELTNSAHNGVVYADRNMMKNIMFNLISNAIKYSGEGKLITCEIDEDDKHVHFSVTDHGIGIPESDQKHLFGRFFRASNATNIQGTGLGLNIVAGYVRMLGGSIDFDSAVGAGSTFTVHFAKHQTHNGKDSGH